jgi:16S rRNA U516 pseudouridylate synthase RsuA-like enzyme
LKRIAIGDIELGNLKEGEFREIPQETIKELVRAAKRGLYSKRKPSKR